jgi:Uncharacterized protein conserved in bacteria (DUF2188)
MLDLCYIRCERVALRGTDRTNPKRNQGSNMGGGNDNDRYVVRRPEGWAVVKEDHKRASALTRTQQEAIDRARQITDNLGGGEVRVQNRHRQFREGERVRPS